VATNSVSPFVRYILKCHLESVQILLGNFSKIRTVHSDWYVHLYEALRNLDHKAVKFRIQASLYLERSIPRVLMRLASAEVVEQKLDASFRSIESDKTSNILHRYWLRI